VEELVKLQKSFYNEIKLRFIISTNMTRLPDDFVTFVSNLNIDLSITLDGSELIHNTLRPHKLGANSFKMTYKTIKKLCEYDIGFGIRTTLSSHNVDYLPDLFDIC
jgi:uncharacterized protein